MRLKDEASKEEEMKHRAKRKQLRRNIIVSIITVAVLSAALYAVLSKNKETPSSEIEKIEVSDTIAIVNEDVGIEYPSGTVNYSDEFIKTLDEEEFAVTSATDAEDGLRDGSYAGVLLFPANLSSDILNPNYSNPQRIKLQYVISKESDKALSDETHTKIIETYQDFNYKLSYAYLSAMMEEVETGQYSITKIFENDASILEAAEKFSSGEYDSEYEEPDLPENDLEYEEQDVNEYQTSGMNYLHDVNELYQKAYTKAHALGTSKTGSIPTEDSFTELTKAMLTHFDDVEKYRDELDSYRDELEEFAREDKDDPGQYQQYVKKVGDYLESVEAYEDAEEAYRSKVAEYVKAVNEYIQIKNPDEDDKKDMKEIEVELMTYQKTGKNNETVETLLKELTSSRDKVLKKKGGIEKAPKLPKEQEFTDAGDFDETVGNFEEVLSKLYDSVDSLTEGLKPENMLRATEGYADNGKTYKDILDEKYKKFSTDTTDTTNRFNTIQTNNIEKLNKAYEKNSEYMEEKVDSLNDKAASDQEKIGKAIEEFLRSAKAGSEDNKKRLETFRNMLSKAKVGGRISSEVMKFLIQPIELEEYSKS